MKADWCGTFAEQKRHRMGWITAVERKNKAPAAEKCSFCVHISRFNSKHCDLGDFATRPNCYCKEFKPKNETDKSTGVEA